MEKKREKMQRYYMGKEDVSVVEHPPSPYSTLPSVPSFVPSHMEEEVGVTSLPEYQVGDTALLKANTKERGCNPCMKQEWDLECLEHKTASVGDMSRNYCIKTLERDLLKRVLHDRVTDKYKQLVKYEPRHIEGGKKWNVDGVSISMINNLNAPITLVYEIVPVEERLMLEEREKRRQKSLRLTPTITEESLPLQHPLYYGGGGSERAIGTQSRTSPKKAQVWNVLLSFSFNHAAFSYNDFLCDHFLIG